MSPGLLAAKLALGPLLLPQARWLSRTALRLPEAAGAREGRVGTGEVGLRLLVIGDSSAAGVGVADVRRWTRQHGLGYCALQWAADAGNLAPDGFHPGPALYPHWTERLAQIIVDGRDRWAGPR